MKTNLIIIIFFIILISSDILIIGCFDVVNEDSHYFEYRVRVETESNIDYYIWIPIALELESGNISKMMESLQIDEGEGRTEIIETKYGDALNVSSSEDIKIYSYKEEQVPYAYLSMSNNSFEINEEELYLNQKYDLWIYLYSDYSNITINVDIIVYVWDSDEKLGYSVSSKPGGDTIKFGWNLITVGTSKSMV